MPNFKAIETGAKFIPVDFAEQVLPGTFEYALCHLIDNELDLAPLRARVKNDGGGASAYDPAVLLKIVLLGYSRGMVSSRHMEKACREVVLFMAVSGDSHPHFTTIAAFVAELGETVSRLFTEVLLVCERQNLIGKELFAIDGVKLPSNASKAKSGSRKDFLRQARKMEKAVKVMVEQHQRRDGETEAEADAREAEKIDALEQEAAKIRQWLRKHPEEKRSRKGKVRLSNRTDNDSAKMATEKGVIQGYTGVAAVDAKAQIVIDAHAHGSGSEQDALMPAVDATARWRTPQTILCTDAGYHSEENLAGLAERGIDAYICDSGYRKRDPRYATQSRHRAKPDPLWDKRPRIVKPRLFTPADFQLAEDHSHCLCPAGKRLYASGRNNTVRGYRAMAFKGAKRDCLHCPLRAQCLRKPATTPVRQVAFFIGKRAGHTAHTQAMKQKIDSDTGKRMIAARFATVEPVFGNLRYNKRLTRFTLRGKGKVDGQWKLYCLVHNIEKLAHHGYAVRA
jgi:transposase